MSFHDTRSLRADIIERMTSTAGRRLLVIERMATCFPPFPSERKRYERLRTRLRTLEAGLAHLGGQLHTLEQHPSAQ